MTNICFKGNVNDNYDIQLSVKQDSPSTSRAPSKQVKVKTTPGVERQEEEGVGMEIAELVKKKQEAGPRKSKQPTEEAIKIHIWDFAGQELYYTTHQVHVNADIIFVRSLYL